MKVKRAILLSIAAYICVFIFGAVYAVISGVDMTNVDQEIPESMFWVSAFGSIAFSALFAWIYFSKEGTVKSAKHGLIFGLIIVAIGFAMDALTLIPALLQGQEELAKNVFEYYTKPVFWFTIFCVVAAAKIVGFVMGQKK